MFSHQFVNSIGNDLYNGYWYRDACWKLHFHRSYEFVWVMSGTLQATVADKVYLLHAGDALFILPYQLHSYTTLESCEFFVAVFAAGHIGKFVSTTSGKEPAEAHFRLSTALQGYLRATMALRPVAPDHKSVRQPDPPLFALKACLYAVCSEFNAVALWQKKEQNNALIFRIIAYVEQNYAEDITLYTLADALSYEYHYLSRVLRENLHIRFRTLVNQYRCERAKELITETDLSLSEIAMNCGFQSIRSFNRAFLEIAGATPTALRGGKQ
ncbi:MAG: helix-turn-helix domain-containing protein [Clostridia bacterium]|nr:helix-turn-helix domain-containing protein [Clostridia bacterium]